jgi:hypothetical protein
MAFPQSEGDHPAAGPGPLAAPSPRRARPPPPGASDGRTPLMAAKTPKPVSQTSSLNPFPKPVPQANHPSRLPMPPEALVPPSRALFAF